jgi:peroxiredoxin
MPTRRLICYLTIGSLGIGSWAAVSFAQQRGSGIAKFKRYDINGDGKLTANEVPSGMMPRLDLNGDGFVTFDEAKQALAPTAPESDPKPSAPATDPQIEVGALFDNLDADKDGYLTMAETKSASWFKQLDSNSDGRIARAEALSLAPQISAELRRNRSGVPSSVVALPTGPEIVKATSIGVGRQLPDLTFTDLEGTASSLSKVVGAHGLVIAYTSTTCPVSKRYVPSLQRLQVSLASQGLGLLIVNPFSSEAITDMRAQGLKAPYLHDTTKAVSAAVQARSTTEVFLLDRQRTLVYRGAVDDQYGTDYNREAPSHRYLDEAITAMLAGRRPIVAATTAPGCELELPDSAPAAPSNLTWHRDVSRILQQNCANCHHDGGTAPFALADASDVLDRAKVIRRVVAEGTMPPWFAKPEPGKPNPWANDCSLADADKRDLLAWLDSDRDLGDPAHAPAPLHFPAGWTHGTPDYEVQLPQPVSIKAEGFMPYQFEVAETTLTEDKWVSGYEIRPTDPSVVHHVIVNVHTGAGKVRDREEGNGGYWAAYVPGNTGQIYPPGFARHLPKGAKISFQIHYTPAGKATSDQMKIGLYFAKEMPRYKVQTIALAQRKLLIPPNTASHPVSYERVAPFDMNVMAYMAHMHVRGQAFRFDVSYPDGNQETLLDIPRYDFNWQLRYDYAKPHIIPRGSKVTVTALFDNSTGNKANPDPNKSVKWGPQTVDEMMIGYLEVFAAL